MRTLYQVGGSLVRALAPAVAVSFAVWSCTCPDTIGEPPPPTCSPTDCLCENEGEKGCWPIDLNVPSVFACRPIAECAESPPLPPPPECQAGLRLESQRPGDCASVYCSPTGSVITYEDPSDYPNDGNECTVDMCVAGKEVNEPFHDGFTCPESGEGSCVVGQCVECNEGLGILCSNGLVCSGSRCVPGHCDNAVLDPEESDYNCGGPCVPCFTGFSCEVADDCLSRNCGPDGVCVAATNMDTIPNGGETGVDCGCPSCTKKCEDGEACVGSTNCTSEICYAGVCQAPTCTDATKNGQETGIDCGGPCEPCSTP